MNKKKIAVLLLAVSLTTALAAMAEERHAAAAKGQAPVLTLTPKLRAALVAEMVGVKAGVAEISVSLASGEWEKTAQRALLIRDSYIMKQKLSPAELEQLERSLPADFVAMDAGFHRQAEGLAHAAHAQDHELAVFYFSKMLEGCGSCHAAYATHTFAGFRRAEPARHTH